MGWLSDQLARFTDLIGETSERERVPEKRYDPTAMAISSWRQVDGAQRVARHERDAGRRATERRAHQLAAAKAARAKTWEARQRFVK